MVTGKQSTDAKVKSAVKSGNTKKAIKLARTGIKKKVAEDMNKKNDDFLPDFLKIKEAPKGGSARRIHFLVFGGRAVLRSTFRVFDTSEDAAKYYREFCAGREPVVGPKGLITSFPGSMDYIRSNMPIKDVLAGKPVPEEGLEDLTYVIRSNAPLTMRSVDQVLDDVKAKEAAGGSTGNPELDAIINAGMGQKRKKAAGLIPLKVLCQELKVDPRQARITLRKAVKNTKTYPALAASHAANARWEWEPGSDVINEVRTALKGIAK